MAMRNIKSFYEELASTGVKLNHMFQITIISNIESVDKVLKDATMWAQSAEVPGRQQEFGPISYLGYDFQIPTKMTSTQDLTVTFNCDDLLKFRDALLFWKATVSDPDIDGGSVSGGNKKMSSATIQLDLYNSTGDEITNTFELKGVFPMDIGVIALSNADAAIATFDAGFKYQYFKNFSPNEFS